MKKLLLTITLLCGLAFAADAQVFYQLYGGGTANVAATATITNSTKYVNVRNYDLATMQAVFALDGSGTSDVTFHIDGSVDGATWVLDAFGPMVIAATGTTPITPTTTNFATFGYILLRARVENGNASDAVTNLAVSVALKQGVSPMTPLPIKYGGSGAATAAAARTALGVPAAASPSLTGTVLMPGSLTVTGSVTNSALTASLPVFTDANKTLASKTVADTRTALLTPSVWEAQKGSASLTNLFGNGAANMVQAWTFLESDTVMWGGENPILGLMGNKKIQLPGASTNYGKAWTIVQTTSGTNAIMLPDATTILWTNTGWSSKFYCDGTNWWVIGR